jgi:type II secretory pathway component PulF
MTSSGDIRSELIFGRSDRDVQDRFKLSDLSVVQIQPHPRNIKNPNESFTLPFLKNLLQLIENKLELVTAINIVKHLFINPEAQALVDFIEISIRDGKSLSKALADFPEFFHFLSIKIIEVAERTARLPEALKCIIDYISTSIGITKRLKHAAIYPAILFCFSMFVLIFWLLLVVPKFSDMFDEIGMELPLLTHYVVKFSSFCLNHAICVSVFLILLISLALFTFKSSRIRKKCIKALPLIGKIRREFVVMNFFYGISIMLQEKINLLDAISSIANVDADIDTGRLEEFIRNGSSVANSMRCCKIFEDYEISIIEAGERSGDLWAAFRSVADMVKLRLQQNLDKIITLIQPITIIFIGFLLILIVCSIVLPMYSSIDLGI